MKLTIKKISDIITLDISKPNMGIKTVKYIVDFDNTQRELSYISQEIPLLSIYLVRGEHSKALEYMAQLRKRGKKVDRKSNLDLIKDDFDYKIKKLSFYRMVELSLDDTYGGLMVSLNYNPRKPVSETSNKVHVLAEVYTSNRLFREKLSSKMKELAEKHSLLFSTDKTNSLYLEKTYFLHDVDLTIIQPFAIAISSYLAAKSQK